MKENMFVWNMQGYHNQWQPAISSDNKKRPPSMSGWLLSGGSVAWKCPILIQRPFDRLVMWVSHGLWHVTAGTENKSLQSNKDHSGFILHYCLNSSPNMTTTHTGKGFQFEPILWLFTKSRSVSTEMLSCHIPISWSSLYKSYLQTQFHSVVLLHTSDRSFSVGKC